MNNQMQLIQNMSNQIQMGGMNNQMGNMNPMMGNNMMMPMIQNQFYHGFQCMNTPKQQDMSPAPYNSQEPTKEPNMTNNSVNKPEGMSQSQASGNCLMPLMNNNYGMNYGNGNNNMNTGSKLMYNFNNNNKQQ